MLCRLCNLHEAIEPLTHESGGGELGDDEAARAGETARQDCKTPDRRIRYLPTSRRRLTEQLGAKAGGTAGARSSECTPAADPPNAFYRGTFNACGQRHRHTAAWTPGIGAGRDRLGSCPDAEDSDMAALTRPEAGGPPDACTL